MNTRRRFRPRFDTLETRLALAVSVTHSDFDNNGTQDLRIIGDAAGQSVIIDDNETSITLSLDANGDGDFTDAGDRDQEVINGVFETFDIQLKDGNDRFTFNAPTSDYDGAVKSLLVDLGKQGDTFLFNAGADRDIANSSVTIDLSCGGGGDEATATFHDITNSSVSVTFDMSGGSDTGTISFAGNINGGSVADAHVDLGAKFNNIGLQAGDVGTTIDNATLSFDVTGGGGVQESDLVSFSSFMKLVNNASLFVKADLGGGNDTFGSALIFPGFAIDATSLLRFDINGEDGGDTLGLIPNGSPNASTDVVGALDVNFGGGAGADSIRVALGNAGSNNLELDGRVCARLSGGSEDDLVSFTFGTDATSTGTADVVLLGNAGKDGLEYNLRDDGNTAFGPAGFALVDGGLGDDTITSATSGAGFDAATLRMRNGADPTGNTPGVTTGDFDGNGTLDLRVVGNDGDQHLLVRDDPLAGTVAVELDLNGDGDTNDNGDVDQVFNGPFETIYIRTFSGKDDVQYSVDSAFANASRSLLAHLGKQADEFSLTAAPGFVWSNSALTFEIVGAGGSESVNADLPGPGGTIADSVLSLDFDVGNGSDTVNLRVLEEVIGAAVVDVRAALGGGARNSFAMELFSNIRQASTVQLQVTGGNVADERDDVTLRFESSFPQSFTVALRDGSHLFVDASLGAGDDRYFAQYQLDRIDIDATSAAHTRIKGGDGDDSLRATRTANNPPTANTDIAGLWSFDFAGGLGADRLAIALTEDSANPANAMELDGTFRYRGHGGGDDDLLQFFFGTASVSDGKLDVISQGGLGNDQLNFNFVDNGNETFPSNGFMLFDGGLGADTVTVTGSGAGFDAASVRERNNES